MIAIDIETYDPDLIIKGPGAIRGKGHIICVGVYGGLNNKVCYRPTDLMLKSVLENNELKIFHNATYDLQWLYKAGFKVNGIVDDTLLRAACINPNEKHNNLDACCKRFNVEGKNFGTIEEWWAEHKAPLDKRTPWEAADEIPFDKWSEYCLNDCRATYDLYNVQQKVIEQYVIQDVCDLERKVIPVTMRMLMNGIRVDTNGVQKVADDFDWDIGSLREDIAYQTGITNVASAPQIRNYFENELKLTSPIKTPTGANSWDKWALKALENPIADMIVSLRSKQTVFNTFLTGSLSDTWNGRLYTQLYQTGRDEGGTITGRYSSARPNLQNIPSDDEKGGHEIRELFLPNEGCLLGAFDYKQIEYRLFAHYAILCHAPGWEHLKEAMLQGADYHLFVQNILKWVYEDEKKTKQMRKITKTLNFGVLYGQGAEKMYQNNYRMLVPNKGQTKRQYVDWVRNEYFTSLPFVKYTCKKIEARAKKNGYVRSIDGRRHPTEFSKVYKSVNKLIQGGAAGILKQGLVNAEEEGIWDILPLHLTVHDENLFSIPPTRIAVEAMDELKKCMIGDFKFQAPMDVDMEIGPNWADVNTEHLNELRGSV